MANINMLCFVLALYVTGALLSGDYVLAKCGTDVPSLMVNIIEPCRSALHSHHSGHHSVHHRPAARPSPECCSALGRTDVTCICQHYPKVMERFVSLSKFAALLGSCGHEFSQGVTCGGSGERESREGKGSEIIE